MRCYSTCTCNCDKTSSLFDSTLAEETNFKVSLSDICHSNVGWYSDKTVCDDHLLKTWDLSKKMGLYVLWHRDDYCPEHELFHMKALYVGKGHVERRLLKHWEEKDFSEELLVYWTYVELPNRQAKYCEQLLLDIYALPFNKSENPGRKCFCAYLTQSEVD